MSEFSYNRPSWEDAPAWANYQAMDEDGEWFWFEVEPKLHCGIWEDHTEGRIQRSEIAYHSSLQKRPE